MIQGTQLNSIQSWIPTVGMVSLTLKMGPPTSSAQWRPLLLSILKEHALLHNTHRCARITVQAPSTMTININHYTDLENWRPTHLEDLNILRVFTVLSRIQGKFKKPKKKKKKVLLYHPNQPLDGGTHCAYWLAWVFKAHSKLPANWQ